MFNTYFPETYTIRPRPDYAMPVWTGGAFPSKYADARVLRAKARYAKRRRNRR